MKRGVILFVVTGALGLVGCVDGKTPDCTSVDSGCFPEDTGAAEAATTDADIDASDAADAKDAPSTTSDAGGDASTD